MNQRSALLLFFVLTFFTGPLSAEPEEKECKKGFIAVSRAFMGNYVKELKEGGVPRVFVKNVKPDDPGGFRFLTVYEPADAPAWYWAPLYHSRNLVPRLISKRLYGKPHDFTPLKGILHTALNRPVRLISKTAFGVKKEPTLPFTVSALLGAAIASSMAIDAVYVGQLEDKVKDEIEEDAAEWDLLIESDFAYHDIADLKARGLITAANARERAYNRYHSLRRYYEHVKSHPEEVKAVGQAFLGNPLFSEVTKIALEGVQLKEGYAQLEGFAEHPSSEQLEELFQLQHALLGNYRALELFAANLDKRDSWELKPELNELLNDIGQDPFVKKLVSFHEQGLLNRRQLEFRLKEDAFWRTRTEQWEVVKIGKLVKENAVYTERPLTLPVIQAQTEAEILSGK